MREVLVVRPASGPPYRVLCGEGAPEALASAWDAAWSRPVMIADSTTDRLFGGALASALEARGHDPLRLGVPPGEGHKTREVKAALEDAMLAAGIDRRGCIIALGGGMVLDLAGFVAATYMRGIAHVNVATTLLSQVDAAVGGKTAVNTPLGKNMVGAFHHPRLVLLDTAALAQLDDAALASGLSEMVKHGVIGDRALFDDLEAWATSAQTRRPPDDLIARAVSVKAEVIAEDDRDRGRRNSLNFGHTAGHAIEHAAGIDHGHAVASGMIIEGRAALRNGSFPKEAHERLTALLTRLGLPVTPACSFETARPFLLRDKKNAGDVRCALPARLGAADPGPEGRFTAPVALAELERAWA
jgi:3-dehydroquinate synthase